MDILFHNVPAVFDDDRALARHFLGDAAAEGLQVISGYELFIGQGVDSWALFTGLPLDEARLRQDLAEGRDAP